MNRKCTIKKVEFGNLRALVHVKIGAMEIRGFKVIEERDGKRWIVPPSQDTKEYGQGYYNIVKFENPDAENEFYGWILKEYELAGK